MENEPYLPKDDAGKAIWMTNFSSRLAVHAPNLGIDATTVTQFQQDSENFNVMISSITIFREYSKQVTGYKNLMRDGTPNGTPIGAIAVAPATITFANPPLGNIFGRVRAIVQIIKNNPNCTPAVADDLGIVGAETEVDLPNMQPILGVELMAGKPNILWKKNKMQGIKLFVDRGAGFQFLALDTQPDYLDTHDLPPTGQIATWKYKAVYVLNDEEVGIYSQELEVVVKANL